jgi:hypothetical protein
MHDKRHPDFARQGKTDLAWERISHETKESGSRLSSFETIQAPQFKLARNNGCTQCLPFPNIVFKHPVAFIYHLFHIYFRLRCSLLSSHPSSSLHVSAVYDHHQVSSILLKLLHSMSKFCVACKSDIF